MVSEIETKKVVFSPKEGDRVVVRQVMGGEPATILVYAHCTNLAYFAIKTTPLDKYITGEIDSVEGEAEVIGNTSALPFKYGDRVKFRLYSDEDENLILEIWR